MFQIPTVKEQSQFFLKVIHTTAGMPYPYLNKED